MFPTPTASDATTGAIIGKEDTFYHTKTGMPRKVNRNGRDGSVGLARLAQMWPTPQTRGFTNDGDLEMLSKMCASAEEFDGMAHRTGIKKRKAFWPTPRAGKNTSESAEVWMKRREAGKVATPPLALAVKMFPTPTGSTGGANHGTHTVRNGKHGINLAGAVKMLPTPMANDAKNNNNPSRMNRKTISLDAVAGGKLNPLWVEWLMGWPIGWTGLDALETDKFLSWRRSHGASFPQGLESAEMKHDA